MDRNEKAYQVIIASDATDRMYNRYQIVYQIIGKQVFMDDLQDCRQDDDKSILNN